MPPPAAHSLRLTALLFTPGSRPERFAKAAASGADGIIVDLEDAVPVPDKERVRGEVVKYFHEHGRVGAPPFVSALRINNPRTDTGRRDLEAVVAAGLRPDLMVLPKVESADEIKLVVGQMPGIPVLGLIETIQGVRRCASIAEASPAVAALGFGGYDLSAETGGEPVWEALLWPRMQVVHACAAAGVLALDQPWINLDDSAGLTEECRRVRALGFTGKLAVHPRQAAYISGAFEPAPEQVERARRIVTAFESAGGHVANIDGQMIDVPMYRSAQRVLQRAGN